MMMSISNLPPETTEQELRALFNGTSCIKEVTFLRQGNREKVMAMLSMNIDIESAEAMCHRYHHRWWHGRVISVNVLLH